MSTLIGSSDTNIYLEDGLFRVKVGGNIAVEISDPGNTGGFASKQYVDDQQITDLANQDGNYSANAHKFTNIAAPTDGNDLANKQYTDEVCQISVGIANNVIISSALTANSTELTQGSTPLNMSNQRITGLSVATSGTDLISRNAADALYYQSTLPLNSITAPDDNVSMNSYKITNLALPTQNADAGSKQYADQGVAGIQQDQIANIADPTSKIKANLAEVTIGSTPLNMNSYKITSLAQATNDADCMSRDAADGRFILSTSKLDELTAPSADLSLASQKITALANATIGTDALNRQTGDARYYSSTVPIQSFELATANLDLNGQKITNLATPTLSTDMVSKSYIDDLISTYNGSAQLLVNNTNADVKLTANQTELTNNNAPMNMNSQIITNLADATSDSDALNRQTGDGRYYQNSVTLDSITAPAASLDLNSYKIIALADATSDTDALNRQTGDGRYCSNATTLNNITTATGDLDMAGYKITDVHAPNGTNTIMTLAHGDTSYYPQTFTLSDLANPTGDLSMNSNKITDLATPTASTDVATRGYAVSNLYASTTPLNSITAPTGSVSMNSNKITDLATPTLTSDMSSRGYAVSSLYMSTTPLNSITAPTGSLSINSQKITNLATPTLTSDLATRGYATSGLYTNTTPLNSITAPNGSLSMNSQKITSVANGSANNDAVSYAQLQTLLSGLGYPRIVQGYVYLGDVPPSTITFGGIVTSAGYNAVEAPSVVFLDINHTAIPFANYLVFAIPYSNRSTSSENDPWYNANPNGHWVYKVSSTRTKINHEYTSFGDGGRV